MATDFQIGADPRGKRIVVAMSGGVDSSVVAALAAASGVETIGVTLQLYDHGEAIGRAGSCCAGRDIRDARAVCDRLGIAHYVFDHETRFREDVIDRFADDYIAGRTPIPCVQCNMGPKFTDLLALARDLGADCLATGHYVRRVEGPAGAELHRGADPARDQSYFLFATTQAQLDYLRFPLGGLPKDRVRAIAADLELGVAAKPDSQDICFVPDGDYAGSGEEAAARGGYDGGDRRPRPADGSARTGGSSITPSASVAGWRSAGRPSRSTSSGWSPIRAASSSARAPRWRWMPRGSNGSTGWGTISPGR